jgi:DNA-directed RNA polymerase specialized sigma24 family protein
MDEIAAIDPVAYNAAVHQLPILTRAVFKAHRDEGRSYAEIADRLSIGYSTVEACVAEALGMIAMMLEGAAPQRTRASTIEPVEQALRQRHRAYYHEGFSRLGLKSDEKADDTDCDRHGYVRIMQEIMPKRDLDVFLLNRIDGMSYKQIARRLWTFEWVIRRRMLRTIRLIAQTPKPFEQWLTYLLLGIL